MLGKVVRSIKRAGLKKKRAGYCYAVTVNKRSLSGNVDPETLDPDLVANHKSLLCVFPEVQSNEGGVC
jgi:hypothetical protein